VLEAHPDASLTVCCEWKVMLATEQPEPGFTAPQKLQKLQGKLGQSQRTSSLGWLQQDQLLELMRQHETYCYPGGPMPEGFGVALVQAQASGCVVIAAVAGALPEVLDKRATAFGLDDSSGPMRLGVDQTAQMLIAEMNKPLDPEERRLAAEALIAKHSWPKVADRFLTAIGEDMPAVEVPKAGLTQVRAFDSQVESSP